MHTRFTDLVGCRLPFQLAVLGGVGTTDLAAAVISAGGLGMVPDGVGAPDAALGPAGIGFLMPFVPAPEVVSERVGTVRVAEFFMGEPDTALVRAGHAAGALVSWQVGSVDEARAAEAAGCDLIVAQGVEAGGHVRGSTRLDQLLRGVLAAVALPVVAAGGIGTPERVAHLLSAGADAVRIGTRFLATPECDAHPEYVRALVAAEVQDAVLTQHFDENGAWPASVRVLASSLEAARLSGNRSCVPPSRAAAGDPLAMACYAGLSVQHVNTVVPAKEVVEELTAHLR
jgi:NAD(P)H-dependent flavin oxidoreductase YrpB (nitropropane dioxygenase family)